MRQNSMIKEIINSINTVISELHQRGDFTSITFTVNQKTVTAVQAVEIFNRYKQDLLNMQARGTAIPELKSDELLTVISAIINSNLAMSKMGQLNTKRSIPPDKARSNNQTLLKLQDQIMQFKTSGKPDVAKQYNPGASISWD